MGATPTFNPNPKIAFETRDPMVRPEPGDVFHVRDPRRSTSFVVRTVRDRGMSSESLTVADIGVGGDQGWVGGDGTRRAMIPPFREFKAARLRRCRFVESWTRPETMQSVVEKVVTDANKADPVETLKSEIAKPDADRIVVIRDPSWCPAAGDVFRGLNPPDYYRVVTPTFDRKAVRVLRCNDRGVPIGTAVPEQVIDVATMRRLDYIGNTRLGTVGLGVPLYFTS